MKKTVTILLASLLTVIVGCASYEPLVSMRGADVAAADPAPEAKEYAGKRPGTQPVRRAHLQHPAAADPARRG
jgi:hypothetical protein